MESSSPSYIEVCSTSPCGCHVVPIDRDKLKQSEKLWDRSPPLPSIFRIRRLSWWPLRRFTGDRAGVPWFSGLQTMDMSLDEKKELLYIFLKNTQPKVVCHFIKVRKELSLLLPSTCWTSRYPPQWDVIDRTTCSNMELCRSEVLALWSSEMWCNPAIATTGCYAFFKQGYIAFFSKKNGVKSFSSLCIC
jgi:hypothetical protein